nr:MAG TPA: hypothetical protein [Caudoviricetes sp.]
MNIFYKYFNAFCAIFAHKKISPYLLSKGSNIFMIYSVSYFSLHVPNVSPVSKFIEAT